MSDTVVSGLGNRSWYCITYTYGWYKVNPNTPELSSPQAAFCSTKHQDIHLHFQLGAALGVVGFSRPEIEITAIIGNHFIVKVKGARGDWDWYWEWALRSPRAEALIAKLCNCNCNSISTAT